jgi:hypothetical protein
MDFHGIVFLGTPLNHGNKNDSGHRSVVSLMNLRCSNLALICGVLQEVFCRYGRMELGTADIMAEMLAFNPELVMPQLKFNLQQAVEQR